VSWFNDFIGRYSRATKPHPQKLANFIDRLTSPLGYSVEIEYFVAAARLDTLQQLSDSEMLGSS